MHLFIDFYRYIDWLQRTVVQMNVIDLYNMCFNKLIFAWLRLNEQHHNVWICE